MYYLSEHSSTLSFCRSVTASSLPTASTGTEEHSHSQIALVHVSHVMLAKSHIAFIGSIRTELFEINIEISGRMWFQGQTASSAAADIVNWGRFQSLLPYDSPSRIIWA